MEESKSTTNNIQNNQMHPPLRRPRTSEDFYLFCKIILEHENYEMMRQQEEVRMSVVKNSMDSAGSSKSDSTETSSVPDNYKSSSSNLDDSDDVDTDSYNLITCYCGKPYAKRPMIECSNCLTWLHLKCVKVKRNNIPEVFYCYKCKIIDNNSTNNIIINQHDDNNTIQQHPQSQQQLQQQQQQQLLQLQQFQQQFQQKQLKNDQNNYIKHFLNHNQNNHNLHHNHETSHHCNDQLNSDNCDNDDNAEDNDFDDENDDMIISNIDEMHASSIITFQSIDNLNTPTLDSSTMTTTSPIS